LGDTQFSRGKVLKLLIDAGKVTYAGNRKLKIYGTFSCSSGKRMKADNRVFFTDEQEAASCGYRPCGHCMRKAYQKWKALN
jgi:methylphosphotriester-DNA--protein-cysteine methyltransferase